MGLFDKFKKTKMATELSNLEPTNLSELSQVMLMSVDTDISQMNYVRMPISELATLGAGVASLMPALRTVTEKATVDMKGLFRVANAGVGDTLKVAKNGDFWGALKTAEGGSKMAKFTQVEPLSVTTQTVMPIDPATMMMAVALYSIEKQLGEIVEMEKKIFTFLEQDKKSKIENDLKTLIQVIETYKYSWNNEKYIATCNQGVADIKKNSGDNIIFYKKQIRDIKKNNPFIAVNAKVNTTLKDLLDKFSYYRLSVYNFAFASFLKIMIEGNFQEKYIQAIKDEIENHSLEYREIYAEYSMYLEKLAKVSLETNILKGLGTASKAIGSVIGSIPIIERGSVDEWLTENGDALKQNSQNKQEEIIAEFVTMSNPQTGIFAKKIDDINRIYNHTSEIYFDKENIYLVEC